MKIKLFSYFYRTIVNENNKNIIIVKTQEQIKIITKNINDVVNDSCYCIWKNGIVEICFDRKRINYWYHGQCMFWYPVKIIDNKIIMYWAFNEDSVFNRGLKKTFGLKKVPKIGNPFLSLTLINDTTLKANYFYPEWVNKFNINEGKGDTLYPSIFIAKI